MATTTRALRWRSLVDGGLEHAVVKVNDTGVTAEGNVIAGSGAGYALRYRLVLDAEFAGTRSFHVTLVGGQTIALRHDGYGIWTDGEGRTRPDLAGAKDVELSASALPTTLPIRRIAFKKDKSAEIEVVAVDAPSMTVTKRRRRITCVEPGALFRVEDPDAGTSVDVTVDADGFVTTLPDRHERVVAA